MKLMSLLVIMSLTCFCLGQDMLNVEVLQELDSLKRENAFDQYYERLNNFQTELYKKGDCEGVVLLNDYYYALSPRSASDSLKFRWAAMYRGNKLNKCAEVKLSLEILLRAHSFVKNKQVLDGYAQYIEKVIGSNYAKLDEYEKSKFFYYKAIKSFENQGKYELMTRAMSDLGNSYKWNGEIEKAKQVFNEALNVAKNKSLIKGELACRQGLLEFYLSYGYDSLFLDQFDQTIKILEKRNHDLDYFKRKGEILSTVGQFYSNQGDFKNSIKAFQEGLHFSRKKYVGSKSREISKIYQQIAELYLNHSKFRETSEYLDTAFSFLIKDYFKRQEIRESDLINENTIADLLYLRAKLNLKKYQSGLNDINLLYQGLKDVDFAFHTRDLLHKDLALINTKLISAETNKEFVGLALDILYELKLLGKNELERVDLCFKRSKHLVLSEQREINQRIRELTGEEYHEVEILQKDLFELIQEMDRNGESRDSLQLVYVSKKDSLNQLLPSKSNVFEEWEGPYVEYVTTEEWVYLMTNITEDKFYRIGKTNEINNTINELLSLINKKNNLEELLGDIENFTSQLLPSEVGHLDRLTIIPDGRLAIFPFDILICNNKYLIEEVALNYYLSRTTNTIEKPRKLKNVVCWAPIYQNDGVDSTDRSGIYALPHAQDEAENILGLWQGASSRINSLDQLIKHKTADIFHYAGHAIVDGSRAYLQTGDNEQQETVTYNEISHLNLDFDLVTLSACETGLGQFQEGDGMRSMANAFLTAGVNSLVYSLWRVNDQTTSDLMTQFYKNLNGNDKTKAMQKAKLEYLENAAPFKRHPYYWAGFCVISSDNLPSGNMYYWLIGISVLLIGYFINKMKNK